MLWLHSCHINISKTYIVLFDDDKFIWDVIVMYSSYIIVIWIVIDGLIYSKIFFLLDSTSLEIERNTFCQYSANL